MMCIARSPKTVSRKQHFVRGPAGAAPPACRRYWMTRDVMSLRSCPCSAAMFPFFFFFFFRAIPPRQPRRRPIASHDLDRIPGDLVPSSVPGQAVLAEPEPAPRGTYPQGTQRGAWRRAAWPTARVRQGWGAPRRRRRRSERCRRRGRMEGADLENQIISAPAALAAAEWEAGSGMARGGGSNILAPRLVIRGAGNTTSLWRKLRWRAGAPFPSPRSRPPACPRPLQGLRDCPGQT